MFKYGISCSLEPQPVRQPVIIRGEIEYVADQVRKAGYDAIELFIRDPKQYDPARLVKAAADEELEFCAISTGMEFTRNGLCLISDDAANRQQAVDRLKEHIELGAAIGSPVVVGIMRGSIPDFEREDLYLGYYREALALLCDYAKEKGVKIYVESIMRYINNYLNSVPETAAFLRGMNKDNLFLHIDTHSMAIEDHDEYNSVKNAADIIGYVHFSDNNRGYPGAGNVDFKTIMRALYDAGYNGYISTECTPYPTEFDCAKRGLDYMKALETIISIEAVPMMAQG